MALRLVA